jgi:hypothetical protein
MKTVYDKAESKNKDSLQALGIVYNVPKLLMQLIEKNPELNQTAFIRKGYDPKKLDEFIQKLEKSNDPFALISEEINKPIAKDLVSTAKLLAEQKQPVVIKKASDSPQAIVDKKLEASTFLAGTGEQTLETYDPITGKTIKSTDQTDPAKNFNNQIIVNLLSVKRDAINFDNITYKNHTGFRYKAMFERNLPEQFIYPKRKDLVEKNIILAITDVKGNFLYFRPDGSIGNETDGKIVYSFLKRFNSFTTISVMYFFSPSFS